MPSVSAQFDPATQQLICSGEWKLENIVALKTTLSSISWPGNGEITIQGSAITAMDSAGAWLLGELLKKFSAKKIAVQLKNFSEQHQILLSLVEKQTASQTDIPVIKPLSFLARLGQITVQQAIEFRDFLHFVGKLSAEYLRLISHPRRIRWNALTSVIDKTGFQALPIIALLSFMIGVVLTYQMGIQLRNYGANIFIVDLLGISILREFGPLITAIMVAGRTGAAFTAQLGTMKFNQEIDALNTLGITPAELLLLPRIIGLAIALPLLTIWADIFGVLGGMLMSNNMLDITSYDFIHRFEKQVPLKALLIGLGKAPVFALIIGSIGCFQGMRVQNNADSIGKQTTRSVVLAIFFIIVADAIFSIIFSKLRL